MTGDPWLDATHDYATRMRALVEAGHVNASIAWALLIADTLALSLDDAVPPDTADELLRLASTWAAQRRAAGLEELVVDQNPVPDDARDLDPGEAP